MLSVKHTCKIVYLCGYRHVSATISALKVLHQVDADSQSSFRSGGIPPKGMLKA